MSLQKGLLIIFNVCGNRDGTENDANRLKITFEELNAEVRTIHNPDENLIKKTLLKPDYSKYFYVAVAFLSHGGEDDHVKTTSNDIMRLQKTILIPLCNIPELNQKLKWLIMQTCRGNYDCITSSTEGGNTSVIKYPMYCVKFFACSQGTKSYRTSDGSFFIKALCGKLKSEYSTKDIMSIMEAVKSSVEVELMNHPKNIPVAPNWYRNQIPSAEDNLGTKKFYLTNGFQ